MKQMPKIKVSYGGKVKMECPNCKENFDVIRSSNKYCEWFGGECETCGYKFQLKDNQYDFIQPNSPFFELIYKFHPEKDTEKNKKIATWNEQKRKEGLEEKYHNTYKSDSARGSTFKPWEKRTIEREVLNND